MPLAEADEPVEVVVLAGPTRGAAPRRRKTGSIGRLLSQVVTGLLILGLWQLVVSQHWIRPSLSASPLDVGRYLVQNLFVSGSLWPDVASTLLATIIAFVLGSVAGVLIGVILGLLPKLEAALDPYLNALNSMPRIALAPLFVLYFGFGTTSKVALAFSLVIFILIANARAGVVGVDRELLRLAAAHNATKVQTVMKILLPGSVPAIFAGLRVGLVYSLLGVVTSELIAAQKGLGVRVTYYAAAFNMTGIYGILILLALIGSILTGAMVIVERRLLWWQQDPGENAAASQ